MCLLPCVTRRSQPTSPSYPLHHHHPSNNFCLCGDTPPWLNGSTVNGTSNGTMSGNGTGFTFHANGTNLGTPCATWPPQCDPVRPPLWYVDNPPLLALRDFILAANNNSQTQAALGFYNQYRVPCTNSNTTGTCDLCDWNDTCGAVRPSDSKLLCNYKLISCRDRRVVGVHLSREVGDVCLAIG